MLRMLSLATAGPRVTRAPCDGTGSCPYYFHTPEQSFYEVKINGETSFVYQLEKPAACVQGGDVGCAWDWDVKSQSWTSASADFASGPATIEVHTRFGGGKGRLAQKAFLQPKVASRFGVGSPTDVKQKSREYVFNVSAAGHFSVELYGVDLTDALLVFLDDAAAEQPQAAAEACAAAFDFFEALFPTLTSNATVSELVALQKAIVQMQERELRPGDDLGGSARRGRLSELAARYLASPCEDDRKSHPALVKALFECQTAYSTQPRELLDEWTEEILPELAESADRSSDQQPTLSLQTAPSFLVHLFALLDSQAKVLELPLKTKKGKEVQLRTEEVSAKLEELQWLTRAFVALILTTRTLSSATIIKQTIKHAATFLARFVSQALPFLSAHFKVQHQPICQLLKSLQPATRLLQAQCATVKQQQQVGALKGVVALKKELEGVVFGVKAMLQEHKCQDSFWLGNLKHKNAAGEEVSSQMQAAASIA